MIVAVVFFIGGLLLGAFAVEHAWRTSGSKLPYWDDDETSENQ